jgi:hypothetical protein
VTFAKFELVTSYFALTSQDIENRYNITTFPTVILFVGGQERYRWVMKYDLNNYRSVLNAIVAGPPAGNPAPSPARR